MATASPVAVRTIMNPPPPMFPAAGGVTASADAVATAATTALPPLRRTAAPTSEAIPSTETTSPVLESTGGGTALRGWAAAGAANRTAARPKRRQRGMSGEGGVETDDVEDEDSGMGRRSGRPGRNYGCRRESPVKHQTAGREEGRAGNAGQLVTASALLAISSAPI